MKSLKGKKIVVTGSASGIGAEIASTLREWEAHVIGVDLNDASNTDDFLRADLSEQESIDWLIDQLPSGIDGLSNNAGLPPTRPAAMVLKVNLIGLKYLTENLISKMSDGASIVNLASLAGFGWQGSIDQVKAGYDLDFDNVDAFVKDQGIDASDAGRSYFFSKESLVVWTFNNRWTWRDRGIRMNSVSPGPVETPILPDFLAGLGDRKDKEEVMERLATPKDLAPVVAFLLSDETSWFRGSNITLDGGLSSHMLTQKFGL
ncbi:MAG: coniferyl-alcohol dehydrogenase [Pseudomonadota bacterium]